MARVNPDLSIDREFRVPQKDLDHSSGAGLILATGNQLTVIFGEPLYADPTLELGGGKSSIEWQVATPRGPFAVYDWKRYDDPAAAHMDVEYWFHLGDHEINLGGTERVHVVAVHTFRVLGQHAASECGGGSFEPEVREALKEIYEANFRPCRSR